MQISKPHNESRGIEKERRVTFERAQKAWIACPLKRKSISLMAKTIIMGVVEFAK